MLTALRSLITITKENIAECGRTLAMSRIDLAKRYSGASLGYFWAVLKPSLFVTVYWFAIAIGVRGGAPIAGVPFIYWLIPGIAPWFFMSEALTIGGSAIRNNKRLVTKMVYPVSTIPTFTVLALFLVHVALVAFVCVVFVLTGFGLSLYALQLPYYLACSFALALSLGLLLSTLTVLSRDVEHMIKSTVQVMFWLTPIIWPIASLGAWMRRVIMINPLVYLVEGYRNSLVSERWFFDQVAYTVYFWGFVTAVALLGSFLYAKSRAEFPDVL